MFYNSHLKDTTTQYFTTCQDMYSPPCSNVLIWQHQIGPCPQQCPQWTNVLLSCQYCMSHFHKATATLSFLEILSLVKCIAWYGIKMLHIKILLNHFNSIITVHITHRYHDMVWILNPKPMIIHKELPLVAGVCNPKPLTMVIQLL